MHDGVYDMLEALQQNLPSTALLWALFLTHSIHAACHLESIDVIFRPAARS